MDFFSQLPIDVVHKILEFDGRIKYKNGKYSVINKINLNDKKFDTVKKNILLKIDTFLNIRTAYLYNAEQHNENDSFYIDYFDEKRNVGIIRDYYTYGDAYMISFYKNIRNTFWYKFKVFLKKLLNIYTYEPYFFITNHEYK
jgi:hypothetical protein